MEGALVQLSGERIEAIQREADGYKASAELLDGPPAANRRLGELDELLRRWIAADGQ